MSGEAGFGGELAALRPHLVKQGFRLTGSRDRAEDLAQLAMMKAWAARERFEPGSNMRAWCSSILKNLFLTECRRSKFNGGAVEDLPLGMLPQAPPSQESSVNVSDMLRALSLCPKEQSDALIGVAMGDSYEDVAEDLCVAVGTVKSRVARARVAILEALA